MKTRITIGVDNIPDSGLKEEWGLSLYIEYGEKSILLDAGASDLFIDNYRRLGIDLKDVDYAVLSHAHYDHANGFPSFLRLNDKAKLYVNECVGSDCYFKKLFVSKYIGIPRALTSEFEDRIVRASGVYTITDGVYLVSHKVDGYPAVGKKNMMYRKTPEGWKPDDLKHEQSLVIDTDRGLMIFNSCSHSGPENIINEVRERFPDKKIYGYVGGLHLYYMTNQEIKEVIRQLDESGIEYIATGHCTKDRAYKMLKDGLGDKVHQFRTGLVIEV